MNLCEIVPYPLDSGLLEVRLESKTAWLNQMQIATLFNVNKAAISKHFKNILQSGELDKKSIVSILETIPGKRKRLYKVKYYNLNAIISIGYRVNSIAATKFRIWAAKILEDYILKGYAQNPNFYQQNDKDIKTILEELANSVKELNENFKTVREVRKAKIIKFKPQITSIEYISEPANLIAEQLDWNSDKSAWQWKTMTAALIECGMSNPNKGDCRSAVRHINKVLNRNIGKKQVHGGIFKYYLPPRKI